MYRGACVFRGRLGDISNPGTFSKFLFMPTLFISRLNFC